MEARISSLQRALEESTKAIQAEGERARGALAIDEVLGGECRRLEGALEEAHGRIRELEEALEEAQGKCASLEGDAVDERDALAQERDAAVQERDALAEERDAAVHERDALSAQIVAANSERDEVKASLEEQVVCLTSEKAQLSASLAEAHTLLESATLEKGELVDKVTSLAQAGEDVRADNTKLGEEVASLSGEKEGLSCLVDELTTQAHFHRTLIQVSDWCLGFRILGLNLKGLGL